MQSEVSVMEQVKVTENAWSPCGKSMLSLYWGCEVFTFSEFGDNGVFLKNVKICVEYIYMAIYKV